MIDLALIEACAPNVAAQTIQAIIRVESAGDALALASNRPDGAVRLRPRDRSEAAALAHKEIRAGHSVDIGLMQINSKNLQRLALTVERVLDPCVNLSAGARILTDAYTSAARSQGEGQGALQAALSAYNTGNHESGFTNGYVARYFQDAGAIARRKPTTAALTAAVYAANPTVYRRQPSEHAMSSNTPVLTNELRDFLTPGVQIQLDPNEAEAIGLVLEDALSEADAWESNGDPATMSNRPTAAIHQLHGE